MSMTFINMSMIYGQSSADFAINLLSWKQYKYVRLSGDFSHSFEMTSGVNIPIIN